MIKDYVMVNTLPHRAPPGVLHREPYAVLLENLGVTEKITPFNEFYIISQIIECSLSGINQALIVTVKYFQVTLRYMKEVVG